MPDDNITRAFKEIGFGEIKVKLEAGEIACICEQIIQRPERAGVRTQHIIEKEITK